MRKRWVLIGLLVLFLAAALPGLGRVTATNNASSIIILYSNDVAGNLEPCE